MRREIAKDLSIEEGSKEYEAEKIIDAMCAGVKRRFFLFDHNEHEQSDIETFLQYQRLINNNLDFENPVNIKEGWQIHFKRYLDSLNLTDLLKTASEYASISISDPTAIIEYKICLDLIDSMFISGLYSELSDCNIENDNLIIKVNDYDYILPLVIKGKNDSLKYLGVPKIKLYEKTSTAELDKKIIETEDIDEGFDFLCNNYGCGKENTREFGAAIVEILDVNIISQEIALVDISGHKQVGYATRGTISDLVYPDRNSNRLLASFVERFSVSDQDKRIQLSQAFGRLIGSLAARLTVLSVAETSFLFGSGIMDSPVILAAYDKKVKESSDKLWWKTEIKPLQDAKIFAIYDFLSLNTKRAKLPNQISWAEYLEKPQFKLDMTRGNDPTIHLGYLSGVAENESVVAGYDAGIYMGVIGAYYHWSDQYKAIIKNMPLKNVIDFTGDGCAVADCKALKVKILDKEESNNFYGYYLVDASEAEVVPYDDPSVVLQKKCFNYQIHVSNFAFDIFKKYYPDARIENKKIKIAAPENKVEILERAKVTGVDRVISLPFIVLPNNAKDNLTKLRFVQQAASTNNVMIES